MNHLTLGNEGPTFPRNVQLEEVAMEYIEKVAVISHPMLYVKNGNSLTIARVIDRNNYEQLFYVWPHTDEEQCIWQQNLQKLFPR